ncbi:hypothetical protein [Salinibacter ruber]|jgi:hypothetical protein|uniref:Uncharacterized protein n=2 Tax=Salinibacter ruber TaxID=146919 RepID=A0A9X2U3E6_9BACT|nr:hypothetical protein [Salinibacter ruber]MCS3616939.1 hypothetical protein [Salinibacter ruber]MCS3859284.1 hypothetical protein [Salinibacter ruber]MCS3866122.1 hypothetical protein [Salinibacter ruber]MCS4037801.1 hypothetical protein [Salinibacter ruber]MCS4152089.1 hypothetical protein [Salinibacter ruber]
MTTTNDSTGGSSTEAQPEEEIKAIVRGVQEDQEVLVWQGYRKHGPSDLEALIRHAESGIESAAEETENALRQGDLDRAREAARRLGQHQIRRTVAKRQLSWRARYLEAPPEWGGDQFVPPLLEEELADDQVRSAEKRLDIRAEFKKLISSGHSKSEAYDQLEARYPAETQASLQEIRDGLSGA